jgi:uncharacterized C2H2 Zn-finger protein
LSVICSSCGVIKEDFKDLAKHVVASRKGHKKSRPWALKFLSKVRILDQKRDVNKVRIKLTETEKENKRSSKIQISGVNKEVSIVCPNCGEVFTQEIPVEYVGDVDTWRQKDGSFVINCEGCRRKK